MRLLLPASGRDSDVTVRNHTVAGGKSIQDIGPPTIPSVEPNQEAELGIDVGYIRQVKSARKIRDSRKASSSIAVVVAGVGSMGKQPRIWASALPCSKPLHADMSKFLSDSGYAPSNGVCVRIR